MAIKRFSFIVAINLISNLSCLSQGLRIDLSISWDSIPVYFRGYNYDNMKGTPFLRIIYNNISGSNIYFKKVSDFNGLLPISSNQPFVFMHSFVPIRNNTVKSVDIQTNSASDQFLIDLANVVQEYLQDRGDSFENNLRSLWKMKAINNRQKEFITVLNIEIINEIISRQLFLNLNNPEKQLIFFNYPRKAVIPFNDSYKYEQKGALRQSVIFTDENQNMNFPVNEFKNDFCFIKKHDSVIQKINLLPLLLIGGTYNFTLNNHMFEDYLKVYPTDLLPAKTIKMKLPKYVGAYSLYTGTLNANDLSVTFEGKKDNGYIIIGKK